MIQVGGDGPADVRLPVTCTADELRLACRLLGEVVRLRRLQQQANQTQRELALAAFTDSLTGLANRRAWDEELARRLTHAADRKSKLCLAVLDMDQFKEINDTQGHVAGDRVLQAAGTVLQQSLRQGDFVARLGGDEFGMLAWVPGEIAAATIVERARRRIAEAVGGANTPKITASAGFALSGGLSGRDTCESLFLAADAALLKAKRERGNAMQAEAGTSIKIR